MSEWTKYELKELTSKIGSGATPRGGQEAYKTEGISLIRSQNILDFSFSYNGLAFIDEDQAYKLKNVVVEEDDILINITGDSVARVTKVPQKVLPARVNQHVAILRASKQKLDSDYLLYYLLNPFFKNYLLKIASNGATRNALTKTDLEDLIISAPVKVTEQQKIAKTLSLLDDKITLLRQQNQTLEELAQTLFKRWFVDFEFPNEKGEGYKSSGGKMVNSELGEIPEGWRVGELGEFSILKSGYAFKSVDFVDSSSIKTIKIKDLQGNGVVDISGCSSIDSHLTAIERVNYFKLSEGDIVLAMSGNTTGKIGVIPPHQKELYLNQRVGKFFLKDSIYVSFVYNFLMSGDYEEKILSMGYGSAQPNINPSQIEAIEIIIPKSEIMMNYIKISDPIYQKVLSNNKEIQSLTELRDTLLPKLMSGELKINTKE
jgi:type I restriction enzyme S subunit